MGVGGGLLLCIMSRKWPHPCSITWRLPGSLFSKQLPASFCACSVRRLVRPRRWSELSSTWCAVFDKIWVLHAPARFARGRSSFTVYNWSSPAQRLCHFLHESCLAKLVVCAECLQLVQITTTLHRFSFENLECYKPQDLIMLISFANTELIMAIASWKTSFRCTHSFALWGLICCGFFRWQLHHITLQITSSLLGRDLVAIQGVCVCVCVCAFVCCWVSHPIYQWQSLFHTWGLGILWTATLLLSCKNILHARRSHGHNNHTSNNDGKLGATNSLGQNWTTQLPSLT